MRVRVDRECPVSRPRCIHACAGERAQVGRDYRDRPIIMRKPLCGRWMYDEGQFTEIHENVTCDHCTSALERAKSREV